jgi:hypothetical protein
MDIDVNDYLIINNLIDYKYILEHPYIYIDIYNKSSNIIDNKYHDNLGNLNVIVNNDNNNDNYNDNKTYYFILDGDDYGLAHWIYHAFTCVDILQNLNITNNNIKILTKNNKRIVKNMLAFFNINNEIVYNIDNYNNITYCPLILSLNYKNRDPNTDKYFQYHLNYYINYIKNNLINLSTNNKLLFLPRNNFDNNIITDRIIENTDKIKEIIVNNNGVVLDTYHLNNIKYQFSIINNSNIIVLDFGSSFLFNCIFLENKKIYVIDNTNTLEGQCKILPYIRYLIDYITSKNNVEIINSTQIELIENIIKSI